MSEQDERDYGGLTVDDINAINKLLGEGAPEGLTDWARGERKRIADLQWKLTFLGQRIEQLPAPSALSSADPEAK